MKAAKIFFTVFIFVLAVTTFLISSGCRKKTPSKDPEEPPFAEAVFSTPTLIDNTYFPLSPGVVQLYLGETEDGVETIVVEVLDSTKVVDAVESVVVRDQVFTDELLQEDTYDWYAQDDDGNVWYMGEDVLNYEYDDDDNIIDTNSDGAWEGGIDGATPGILMKASLAVGDSYQQEFYEGVAEDMAQIEGIGVEVELEDGSIYEDCLQTREWNPLESGDEEYKYYASDVGLIKEELVEGDEAVEQKAIFFTGADRVPDSEAAAFTNPTTIDNTFMPLLPGTTLQYESETEDGVETTITEVLSETRIVDGIECVVFRDQVFLEDLLIEDTYDWFAQDDDGNIWYLGEEVTNYEYDDEDNLVDTNDDGSWEAGVDGALPGIYIPAQPEAGASYYQEYYEGEAEDMGYVVATGVEVELADGTVYENCLQTLDWNPMEPALMDYKYYAPGVGLVKEEAVGGDEIAELI